MIALLKACLIVCLCLANYGIGVFTTEKKYKKAEEKKDDEAPILWPANAKN